MRCPRLLSSGTSWCGLPFGLALLLVLMGGPLRDVAQPRRWTVSLSTATGEKLGVQTLGVRTQGTMHAGDNARELVMEVQSVNEFGLLAEHNKRHPLTVVQPGDLLLSMNGVPPLIGIEGDDWDDMLAEFGMESVVRNLVVERPL